MTDELRRLRAQLSCLQSLLTLSKLMGDSGDQPRIAQLAATAVPSLGVLPAGRRRAGRRRLGLVGPAGGSAAALGEIAGALQRLGRQGGAVASPEMAPGWVWPYPMQGAAGHVGFLVVAAAAEPPAEDRFVPQSLAQQTGVALINARLQADERAAPSPSPASRAREPPSPSSSPWPWSPPDHDRDRVPLPGRARRMVGAGTQAVLARVPALSSMGASRR